MITKSLAGSSTKYVVLMGRMTENLNLHIQGPGKKVNRPYGMSCTIKNEFISPELVEYMKGLNCLVPSFADQSYKKYFALQATFYNDGNEIHFQIKNPENTLGKDYGTSFSIPTLNLPSDLVGFLKLELYGG